MANNARDSLVNVIVRTHKPYCMRCGALVERADAVRSFEKHSYMIGYRCHGDVHVVEVPEELIVSASGLRAMLPEVLFHCDDRPLKPVEEAPAPDFSAQREALWSLVAA